MSALQYSMAIIQQRTSEYPDNQQCCVVFHCNGFVKSLYISDFEAYPFSFEFTDKTPNTHCIHYVSFQQDT